MKWLFVLLMACAASNGPAYAGMPAYANTKDGQEARRLCEAIGRYGIGSDGFLPSYPAASGNNESRPLKGTAFVYDNALAAMAFLACGDVASARRIGNALVSAQGNDRFYRDGRLRNAYLAGRMETPVKLPGWWNGTSSRWEEDEYQASTAVGNVAWAALALLQLFSATNDERYLASARSLASWISQFDTASGVTGGVSGFEPNARHIAWKSTEHNIDTAAVAAWLSRLDGDPRWSRLYCSSADFVGSMVRTGKGYLIGTTTEDKPNLQAGLYLDTQLWPYLAFDENALPATWKDIETLIDRDIAVGGGFDFNGDRDGVWMEGTAQAALVFRRSGDDARANALLGVVLANRDTATGFIFATDKPQISTNLTVGAEGGGGAFNYYRWPHLGATAWTVLALTNFNPFTDQRGHHAVRDRKQCS